MKKIKLNRNECNRNHHQGNRGPTSYHMHDPLIIFDILNLKEGDIFLDLGCGTGEYSIQASKIVGKTGKVFAIDKWDSIINNLSRLIKSQGIKNILVWMSDISQPLDIKDNSIDVCFIVTVLHCLDLAEVGGDFFNEIHRVLKPGGRLVIIECNTKDLSRGPPLHARVLPEDLESLLIQYSFKKINYLDLGFNYLMEFEG